MHFLTGFFVLNAFLIPPKHIFPIGRLLLWFGFGNIAFREGYEDIDTWNTYGRKNNPVEGRHRYLTVAILCTEAVLAYKYRYGTGNLEFNPTPLYVSIPWTIIIAVCFSYWIYLRFLISGRTTKYIEHPTPNKNTEKKGEIQNNQPQQKQNANKKKN